MPSLQSAPSGGTVEVDPYRLPATSPSSGMMRNISAVASTVLSSQLAASALFAGGTDIHAAGVIGALVGGSIGSYVLGSDVAKRIVGGTGQMISGLSSDIHFMPMSSYQRSRMISRRYHGDELPLLPTSETDRLQLEAWAKHDRAQQEREALAQRLAQEQTQLARGMLPGSSLDTQAGRMAEGEPEGEGEGEGEGVLPEKFLEILDAAETVEQVDIHIKAINNLLADLEDDWSNHQITRHEYVKDRDAYNLQLQALENKKDWLIKVESDVTPKPAEKAKGKAKAKAKAKAIAAFADMGPETGVEPKGKVGRPRGSSRPPIISRSSSSSHRGPGSTR